MYSGLWMDLSPKYHLPPRSVLSLEKSPATTENWLGMFDPYNYKWAGRRHICPKYPTTSGRRVGRALLQLSLHKNLSWESLMWVKWAHWSVRRLLCRCICSKSSSIQHQRQWSCQSWVLAMRVGALYQFPHASLSFFQLPLFYILVEIIDSSIKDYSIWQVLWDPIINRVTVCM